MHFADDIQLSIDILPYSLYQVEVCDKLCCPAVAVTISRVDGTGVLQMSNCIVAPYGKLHLTFFLKTDLLSEPLKCEFHFDSTRTQEVLLEFLCFPKETDKVPISFCRFFNKPG